MRTLKTILTVLGVAAAVGFVTLMILFPNGW